MKQEYDTMINNNTWPLIYLPCTRQVVGWKWVFKVEENVDDSKKV